MIKEIKTYWCDSIPTNDDLLKGIDIANALQCLVEIKYFHYDSYDVSIEPDSILEDVKKQIPKVWLV